MDNEAKKPINPMQAPLHAPLHARCKCAIVDDPEPAHDAELGPDILEFIETLDIDGAGG